MYIDNISLVNFRNYDNLTLKLKQGINIIYGNNAQGKTNLLESIYVLALTKSHRSFIDNNLIKNNKASTKVIPTSANWYGVTYKEDTPGVKKAIQNLVDNHEYNDNLWD